MLYGYHTHIWLVYIIHPIGDFWLVCKTKNLGTKCLQRQKVPWHFMYKGNKYSLRYCEWHRWKERKKLPLFGVTPTLKSYEKQFWKKRIYIVSHVVVLKIVLNRPIRISNRLIWQDILKSSFICTDWYVNELTLI